MKLSLVDLHAGKVNEILKIEPLGAISIRGKKSST